MVLINNSSLLQCNMILQQHFVNYNPIQSKINAKRRSCSAILSTHHFMLQIHICILGYIPS